MGIIQTAFNKVSVGSAASPAAASSDGSVPGSGDSIVTAGNYKIDVSFLDSLYAANKLSPAQRDQILAGQDPANFGLGDYDLYYLTCGRLGSKTATSGLLALVATWSIALTYQAGQLVIYQPPGVVGLNLYQAIVRVPAGTLPTNPSYWVQVSGSSALLEADLVNPGLAGLSAPSSGILGLQSTSGTPLAGVIVPAGRGYRVTVSEIRPVTPGGATPTDSNVRLVPLISEQLNGDGSRVVTITPRWSQTATANASAIAAVGAASLTAHLTLALQ